MGSRNNNNKRSGSGSGSGDDDHPPPCAQSRSLACPPVGYGFGSRLQMSDTAVPRYSVDRSEPFRRLPQRARGKYLTYSTLTYYFIGPCTINCTLTVGNLTDRRLIMIVVLSWRCRCTRPTLALEHDVVSAPEGMPFFPKDRAL